MKVTLLLLAAALIVGLVPVAQGTPPSGWTVAGVVLVAIALHRIFRAERNPR